jgi:hypothetical protein
MVAETGELMYQFAKTMIWLIFQQTEVPYLIT